MKRVVPYEAEPIADCGDRQEQNEIERVTELVNRYFPPPDRIAILRGLGR